MKTGKAIAATLVCTLAAVAALGGSAIGTERVGKPTSTVPERRARRQPTVPDNYRELPFQEHAPVPDLSVAERQGNIETRDLGGDFRGWHNETQEGKTEVTRSAGQNGKQGLRWSVTIDYKSDGGGPTSEPSDRGQVGRRAGESLL